MTFQYTPKFKKQYKKLPKKFQDQFDERLKLFSIDQINPKFKIHPLKGKFFGYWSMNINGDLRALYLKKGETIIIFALIGTHSELYG